MTRTWHCDKVLRNGARVTFAPSRRLSHLVFPVIDLFLGSCLGYCHLCQSISFLVFSAADCHNVSFFFSGTVCIFLGHKGPCWQSWYWQRMAGAQIVNISGGELPSFDGVEFYYVLFFYWSTYPMTDPWCCYIWCSKDPINKNPSHVSIYIYISYMDPMGMGYGCLPVLFWP